MTESVDTGLPAQAVAPWGQQPPIPPVPAIPPIEQVSETQETTLVAEGISLAGADLSTVPIEESAAPVPETLAAEETPLAPPAPLAAPEIPPIPPAPAPAPEEAASTEESEMVTVTVPKAFKLRMDSFAERQVVVGIQEMRRDEAEHWYSKANGVTIYRP